MGVIRLSGGPLDGKCIPDGGFNRDGFMKIPYRTHDERFAGAIYVKNESQTAVYIGDSLFRPMAIAGMQIAENQ